VDKLKNDKLNNILPLENGMRSLRIENGVISGEHFIEDIVAPVCPKFFMTK
jgi:hypothetical protein